MGVLQHSYQCVRVFFIQFVEYIAVWRFAFHRYFNWHSDLPFAIWSLMCASRYVYTKCVPMWNVPLLFDLIFYYYFSLKCRNFFKKKSFLFLRSNLVFFLASSYIFTFFSFSFGFDFHFEKKKLNCIGIANCIYYMHQYSAQYIHHISGLYELLLPHDHWMCSAVDGVTQPKGNYHFLSMHFFSWIF